MAWFLAVYRKEWLKTVYPLRDVPPHHEVFRLDDVASHPDVLKEIQPYLPHELNFTKYNYRMISLPEPAGKMLDIPDVIERILAMDRRTNKKKEELSHSPWIEYNPIVSDDVRDGWGMLYHKSKLLQEFGW